MKPTPAYITRAIIAALLLGLGFFSLLTQPPPHYAALGDILMGGCMALLLVPFVSKSFAGSIQSIVMFLLGLAMLLIAVGLHQAYHLWVLTLLLGIVTLALLSSSLYTLFLSRRPE